MMKKNILTTFGSIATAVFASLCCIGPAILALAAQACYLHFLFLRNTVPCLLAALQYCSVLHFI